MDIIYITRQTRKTKGRWFDPPALSVFDPIDSTQRIVYVWSPVSRPTHWGVARQPWWRRE